MCRATSTRSGFSIARRLLQSVPAILLLVAAVPASAEPLEELDTPVVVLDSFDFEGLKLPKNIDQLKRQYPKLTSDTIGLDEKVGLTCYSVKDLPQADLARFYFYDGAFYQLAISYKAGRVDAMGGMPAVVRIAGHFVWPGQPRLDVALDLDPEFQPPCRLLSGQWRTAGGHRYESLAGGQQTNGQLRVDRRRGFRLRGEIASAGRVDILLAFGGRYNGRPPHTVPYSELAKHMSAHRYQSFAEFWPYYVREHSTPACRSCTSSAAR